MKINILGAGNVASHLASAFRGAGHSMSIWNRSEESLRPLVEEGHQCTTNMEELPVDADLVIISVKDSAVREVAKQLASVVAGTNIIVVHTAGSLSIDELRPLFGQCGVLYPMQTFTKSKALDYSKIPFFIEGSDTVLKTLRDALAPVSQNVFVADSSKRKMLHLASVFACNFVNHNIAIACNILDRAGLSSSSLLPLIAETVEKLECCSPVEAQTGPAVREDYNIIAEHLNLLDAFPEERKIYEMETKSIIEYKNEHLKGNTK